MQPSRVAEYKLTEIVRCYQLVLYQFISLLQLLTHVHHIEVANVRPEDEFELVIAMLVKSPGRDHVIRLAAKVKMLGKLLAQVMHRGDPGSYEIVQGVCTLAFTQLLQALKRCDQTQAAHQLVHLVRIRLATVTCEEVSQHLLIQIRGSDVSLHGTRVTLLPVPNQISEQVAGPAHAPLQHGKSERRETPCHASQNERLGKGM